VHLCSSEDSASNPRIAHLPHTVGPGKVCWSAPGFFLRLGPRERRADPSCPNRAGILCGIASRADDTPFPRGPIIKRDGRGQAEATEPMSDATPFYITTAIDYPNSRPHIGTAFEKIGADVQARFRRMEKLAVHFQMGNDENTIKVSQRAFELGVDPKSYVDDMADQFKEVWGALEVSFDDFIQTSEERHKLGCQRFIQAVNDA